MTERDLFGLRVEIDEEATRAWYAQADEWTVTAETAATF